MPRTTQYVSNIHESVTFSPWWRKRRPDICMPFATYLVTVAFFLNIYHVYIRWKYNSRRRGSTFALWYCSGRWFCVAHTLQKTMCSNTILILHELETAQKLSLQQKKLYILRYIGDKTCFPCHYRKLMHANSRWTCPCPGNKSVQPSCLHQPHVYWNVDIYWI